MLENYERRLREEGRDERLRQIAETIAEEPAEAEGAFALAAAVALADDEVADEENALINQLAEWFGIAPERSAEILTSWKKTRSRRSSGRVTRFKRHPVFQVAEAPNSRARPARRLRVPPTLVEIWRR